MKICEKPNSKPYINFHKQFALASEATKTQVFDVLVGIAKEIARGNIVNMGAIIVLGDFSHSTEQISGFVQMKPKENPIKKFMFVNSDDGIETITKFSKQPYDGAIIVNYTGQIIGAGVYLVVDDPTLDIPDGCGTRHKAAASFSLRNDVIAVLTLSEESNIIRVWKSGNPEKVVEP